MDVSSAGDNNSNGRQVPPAPAPGHQGHFWEGGNEEEAGTGRRNLLLLSLAELS